MASAPAVSIVTSTYNWPNALRLAMQTALSQTFADFEYIIVGDGCTDETEAVVKGFDDPRIVWRNLEENSGNQARPNQVGLEMARGEYVAYLNHDDLWFPDHLGVMLSAIRRQDADISSSLCIEIAPPGNPYRGVIGGPKPSETGVSIGAMTTSVVHRREAGLAIGGWRDWRTLEGVPTQDFFFRLSQARSRHGFVPWVSSLKFHSADRPNSYVTRTADEQAAWLERMRTDPHLRHRLLAQAAVSQSLGHEPPGKTRLKTLKNPPPGWQIEQYRLARGLPPMLDLGRETEV
jgi:glycosyltransferase involved in cell wall biosynthesis